jgi:hypothetical protein
MGLQCDLAALTLTVDPAPVGMSISIQVRSELNASIVVTTDNVVIGVAVGTTATIFVSIKPDSVTLISVNVVAVTIVEIYIS